jgi:hypothetical protein
MFSHSLQRILDNHGENLTLTYKTLGTYDPATGGLTGGTAVPKIVKCYLCNYGLSDMDGINLIFGDRKALMSPVDASGNTLEEPEVGDEVSGSGDKVSIISVQKIYSAGVVMCYIMQVRE